MKMARKQRQPPRNENKKNLLSVNQKKGGKVAKKQRNNVKTELKGKLKTNKPTTIISKEKIMPIASTLKTSSKGVTKNSNTLKRSSRSKDSTPITNSKPSSSKKSSPLHAVIPPKKQKKEIEKTKNKSLNSRKTTKSDVGNKMSLRGKKRSYTQLASGTKDEDESQVKKRKTVKGGTSRNSRSLKLTVKGSEWRSTIHFKGSKQEKQSKETVKTPTKKKTSPKVKNASASKTKKGTSPQKTPNSSRSTPKNSKKPTANVTTISRKRTKTMPRRRAITETKSSIQKSGSQKIIKKSTSSISKLQGQKAIKKTPPKTQKVAKTRTKPTNRQVDNKKESLDKTIKNKTNNCVTRKNKSPFSKVKENVTVAEGILNDIISSIGSSSNILNSNAETNEKNVKSGFESGSHVANKQLSTNTVIVCRSDGVNSVLTKAFIGEGKPSLSTEEINTSNIDILEENSDSNISQSKAQSDPTSPDLNEHSKIPYTENNVLKESFIEKMHNLDSSSSTTTENVTSVTNSDSLVKMKPEQVSLNILSVKFETNHNINKTLETKGTERNGKSVTMSTGKGLIDSPLSAQKTNDNILITPNITANTKVTACDEATVISKSIAVSSVNQSEPIPSPKSLSIFSSTSNESIKTNQELKNSSEEDIKNSIEKDHMCSLVQTKDSSNVGIETNSSEEPIVSFGRTSKDALIQNTFETIETHMKRDNITESENVIEKSQSEKDISLNKFSSKADLLAEKMHHSEITTLEEAASVNTNNIVKESIKNDDLKNEETDKFIELCDSESDSKNNSLLENSNTFEILTNYKSSEIKEEYLVNHNETDSQCKSQPIYSGKDEIVNENIADNMSDQLSNNQNMCNESISNKLYKENTTQQISKENNTSPNLHCKLSHNDKSNEDLNTRPEIQKKINNIEETENITSSKTPELCTKNVNYSDGAFEKISKENGLAHSELEDNVDFISVSGKATTTENNMLNKSISLNTSKDVQDMNNPSDVMKDESKQEKYRIHERKDEEFRPACLENNTKELSSISKTSEQNNLMDNETGLNSIGEPENSIQSQITEVDSKIQKNIKDESAVFCQFEIKSEENPAGDVMDGTFNREITSIMSENDQCERNSKSEPDTELKDQPDTITSELNNVTIKSKQINADQIESVVNSSKDTYCETKDGELKTNSGLSLSIDKTSTCENEICGSIDENKEPLEIKQPLSTKKEIISSDKLVNNTKVIEQNIETNSEETVTEIKDKKILFTETLKVNHQAEQPNQLNLNKSDVTDSSGSSLNIENSVKELFNSIEENSEKSNESTLCLKLQETVERDSARSKSKEIAQEVFLEPENSKGRIETVYKDTTLNLVEVKDGSTCETNKFEGKTNITPDIQPNNVIIVAHDSVANNSVTDENKIHDSSFVENSTISTTCESKLKSNIEENLSINSVKNSEIDIVNGESYDKFAKMEDTQDSIIVDDLEGDSMQCNSETLSSNRMSVDEENHAMDIDLEDTGMDAHMCPTLESTSVDNEMKMEVS